jgi:NAD(P)-dependent dehydrogenase (short-subunit alcohol dehydrogenase family)
MKRTPFGPSSTAAEVLDGVDLTGQRAVVTGGGAGLGLATAQALADAGAEVTVAVRSRAVAGPWATAALDLADLRSVARFAEQWQGPLHMSTTVATTHTGWLPTRWTRRTRPGCGTNRCDC